VKYLDIVGNVVILIKPKLQHAFWMEVCFVKSLEFELWTKHGFGAFEISKALSKEFTKQPYFFLKRAFKGLEILFGYATTDPNRLLRVISQDKHFYDGIFEANDISKWRCLANREELL
jgi:hypothetical protein